MKKICVWKGEECYKFGNGHNYIAGEIVLQCIHCSRLTFPGVEGKECAGLLHEDHCIGKAKPLVDISSESSKGPFVGV
jgi:hypothetical protein